MQRRIASFLVIAAVAVVAIALVSWYRPDASTEVAVAEVPKPGPAAHEAPAVSMPVANPTASTSAPTPENVARWIADATGGDAQKRAAAIKGLAAAPRAQAVPVLRRLLTDGEPQVDRRLTLQSLRELALNQGDADGAVREAVRNAIYHGDDLTNKHELQEALDVIEESELH